MNSRALTTTEANERQKQGELAIRWQGTLRRTQHNPSIFITIMVTKLKTNTSEFSNLKKRTGPTLNWERN